MHLMVVFINKNILIFREDLWIRDGVVQNPRTIFFEEKVTPECRVDCHGLIISPGFIDIQLNG